MPPDALKRRAWAWSIRRLTAGAVAGALAIAARPWAVVRELVGVLRAFRWPLSVTVVLVPAEWTFARERYAWHQAERVSVRWRLRAGLVVVARHETAPRPRALELHYRALEARHADMEARHAARTLDEQRGMRRRP